ncbi:MAG: GTPase [Clostridia bacterium]|nr:GTPase [Clostridia bacterium]
MFNREEYPVYLFTGFLESGKTSFINETLSDPNFFKDGDRTLVLLCEDGEVELDPSVFASPEVYVEIIDDISRLNPDKLEALRRKHKANRILLEYNGMWLVSDLFASVPKNWIIYQIMNFVDANTIELFNANMRNLVVDKLSFCELTVFNRCTPETNTDMLHKLVRGVSRRTDIIYERTDGSFDYDDLVDPLPFDVNADVIEIADRDYALWYRDLAESMEGYDAKKVTFIGQATKNGELKPDEFVIGRQIMTCCVDDITYGGLLCENGGKNIEKGEWYRINAHISVKHCPLYGKVGPVLVGVKAEKCDPPSEIVTTFY